MVVRNSLCLWGRSNCVEGKALGFKKWVPKKAQIEKPIILFVVLFNYYKLEYVLTCFDFTWKAMNMKFVNCSSHKSMSNTKEMCFCAEYFFPRDQFVTRLSAPAA